MKCPSARPRFGKGGAKRDQRRARTPPWKTRTRDALPPCPHAGGTSCGMIGHRENRSRAFYLILLR